MIAGRFEPFSSSTAFPTDSAGGWISSGALGRRQDLDLVGEDQVGHVAFQKGVLDGQGHQLGVLAGVQHRLTEGGHALEGGGEIDFLKRARSEHLRVDLTGEGEHRRAVDLGVPQPGEQIRGARPGDGQACRGTAGELAVGRGGEGRGALVADADVGQAPGLFLPPEGVRQAEVRVADHSEDVLHPPVHHRLGHDVRHGPDVRLLFLETDVDAVLTDLDRKGRNAVVVTARRIAGAGVEVPAVPRAPQPAVLDRALAQGPALVRTGVVEGVVPAVEVGQRQGLVSGDDCLDPTLRKLVGVGNAIPAKARHFTPA